MEINLLNFFLLCQKVVEFLLSSTVLFIASGIILLVAFSRKNNNFLDVRDIVAEQFKMLANSKWQFIVFYVTPLLLALAVRNYALVDATIVGNIVVVLSLLISMLFGCLSVLSAFPKKDEKYTKVLRQTVNTIAFECVFCILALLLSFVVLFIGELESNMISQIISVLVYYFIFAVFLNLFIVIKRLKRLFDKKIETNRVADTEKE